jgi:3-hydroxybutyryl-CoA dehydrogenase
MMTFTKITCAGAGTMGSQVAWQMAFHGKHVTVYDAILDGLDKGKAFHQDYAELFMARRGATRELGSRTRPTRRRPCAMPT